VQQFFVTGFSQELAGLAFFLVYVGMSRPRAAGRYSRRTQVLVLLAAIVLVASVPLHYGTGPAARWFVLLLPVLSLVSVIADARRHPPTRR
jgi:hypothetical protein